MCCPRVLQSRLQCERAKRRVVVKENYIYYFSNSIILFMTLETVFVQIGLSLVLFFIVNWIGKHSYSVGYMSMSMFAKVEEAPAMNYLIRVLTPIVYLIICSTILYHWNFDKYVVKFYMVSVYYIAFRLLINIVNGRSLLINWWRESVYWTSIIVLSYYSYEKIIFEKENLFPDFTTMANELWIIILLFLFQITNNVRLDHNGTVKRKENYINSQLSVMTNKYGSIINKYLENDHLKGIAYAILLHENFNRPRIARILEYVKLFLTSKPHTVGVMQVRSDKYISNSESVEKGVLIILANYKKEFDSVNIREHRSEWVIKRSLIRSYNHCDDYVEDIMDLYETIMESKYSNTHDQFMEY